MYNSQQHITKYNLSFNLIPILTYTNKTLARTQRKNTWFSIFKFRFYTNLQQYMSLWEKNEDPCDFY